MGQYSLITFLLVRCMHLYDVLKQQQQMLFSPKEKNLSWSSIEPSVDFTPTSRARICYRTCYSISRCSKCLIGAGHGLELACHSLELIDISDWLKRENIYEVYQSYTCYNGCAVVLWAFQAKCYSKSQAFLVISC